MRSLSDGVCKSSHTLAVIAAIRGTGFMEYGRGALARLDTRELDQLGPFRNVFGEELAELGG
jgi:hypothetical protein